MTKKERDELSDIIGRMDAWSKNPPPGSLAILNMFDELHDKVKELIESYDKRTGKTDSPQGCGEEHQEVW